MVVPDQLLVVLLNLLIGSKCRDTQNLSGLFIAHLFWDCATVRSGPLL